MCFISKTALFKIQRSWKHYQLFLGKRHLQLNIINFPVCNKDQTWEKVVILTET